jgi:SAM-dependent methyltransferase
MAPSERRLYRNFAHYALNQVLLPAKLLVPQPVVGRIPGLTTNKEIRTGIVLQAVQGRLLDIGCGTNALVHAYRSGGGDGVGVDIHPWPGVDLLVENTAKLPFAEESFDTIALVACINHIPNRVDVLREARRLLRPKGRVLITNLTPTLSRIWHGWAFWDADQHERGMKPGEVYGLTRRELIALVESTGFRFVRRVPFSWGLNSLYVFA